MVVRERRDPIYYICMKFGFRPASVLHLGAALSGLYVLFSDAVEALPLVPGDVLYLGLLLTYVFVGVLFFLSDRDLARFRRNRIRRLMTAPDSLLALCLVFFLFEYIFALNANMDYIQRFIESGGRVSLALDTETERRIVLTRYLPLLAASLLTYIVFRLRHFGGYDRAAQPLRVQADRAGVPRSGMVVGSIARVWSLPLTLVSALLHALSFPSFLSMKGLSWTGWFALVPLFLVLRYNRYARSVLHLVVFGAITMIASNYWLATFSLVSLQLTILFFIAFYLVFAVIVMIPVRQSGRLAFFVLAVGWTAFEFARSTGFLGYPWVLTGHSQYSFLPLIQLASVTGVWGVSAVVLLVNAGIASAVAGGTPSWRRFLPLGIVVLVGAAVVGAGGFSLRKGGQAVPLERSVSIALIQQSSDPRKHDYERTFESLRRLTDAALIEDPDLVAWSETAFVPNIRRWSREDPQRYRLARLVLLFLEYQESIGTWLLTGNDDYRRVTDEAGEEIDRLNYNASVLFSPSGRRMETYHKVKLVPFTEYFPYRKQLPWVYELLLEFDVHFWEPGDHSTIFEHPSFRFATPICFEDVFPNRVRLFVQRDLDVILALTNDYWSLSPLQAKQHFVAGLFRAVENRKPMVRATASGLTGHVDAFGRVEGTLPYFEETYMVADVAIRRLPTTVYTRYGDWFPWFAFAGFVGLAVLSFVRRRR